MGKYSALLLSQGVTNYWPLDETSGSTAFAAVGGIDLTTSGTVSMNQLAGVNTGFRFTGSATSSLSAVSNASMTFDVTQGFSFSLILRANATMTGAGAWGIISRRTNSSTNRTFGAFMQGSEGGAVNIDMGANQVRWATGFIPTINQFFHIAFVWRPLNGEYRFYANGELYASATGYTPTSQPASSPFFLGALGASPPSQLFPGIIDEVAVWNNKSLSDAEIKAQYTTVFPITRVFDGTDWKSAERTVL